MAGAPVDAIQRIPLFAELKKREVEEGTKLVTNTLADLKTLIGVVEDTATAVSEQAIASDEIARNMDAVQKIAGEAVASSEEAVIQGEQLHELAYRLEESVRLDPELARLLEEGRTADQQRRKK